MKKILLSFLALGAVSHSNAQSIYPGTCDSLQAVPNVATIRAQAFPLSSVRLLPSRWRDNLERDSAWIMSLPVKSLVHSFQNTAGVWAGKEGGYMTVRKLGGWESLDSDLRGHCVAHLTSALALLYASTGCEAFRLKGDSIVSALRDVQAMNGNGYLSAFPEGLINRNLQGKSVWAPWYTIHKILAALMDQYVYAHNNDALEVAKGMADWAYAKLQGISDAQRAQMLRNEFGGVNEAFYNLYALTANDHYLHLARFFYHNAVIDLLKQQNSDFGKLHTNTFIPKVIAEARNYELTASDTSRAVADFFFRAMLKDHTFATGCLSDKEHFFNPADFSKHLSPYTGETCCSYNMLKLARHLYAYSADPHIMDYYERVLLNQILGQQDPTTGMVHYFQPMQSGAYKLYSTKWDSFWCCVGTGFESNAKLAEAVYAHHADHLYVNLFIPTTLTWQAKGITVTQETIFPRTETTRLTISGSASFTLSLRLPAWSGTPTIKVNGKKLSCKTTDGYLSITRRWKSGDTVEATFPMTLHAETAHGDSSRVALLYGPVVLAGQLGTQGMTDASNFSNPTKYNDYYTYNYQVPSNLPTHLKIDPAHPEHALQKTAEPLTFLTPSGVRVSPLFDIHHQRYVVYWDNTSK